MRSVFAAKRLLVRRNRSAQARRFITGAVY
jgi:hypothetical protein